MPNKKRISSPHIDLVSQNIARRQELESLEELQRQHADLAKKIQVLARGTREIEPAALPLQARVESYLRTKIGSLKQIARALDASPEDVEGVLFDLRKENQVYNIGTDEIPVWTFRVGDIATQDLNALVARLITYRPFTVKELTAATGAKITRVGGAVIAAQRSMHVLDIKEGGKAGRYFVVPSHARDARLRAPTPSTGISVDQEDTEGD